MEFNNLQLDLPKVRGVPVYYRFGHNGEGLKAHMDSNVTGLSKDIIRVSAYTVDDQIIPQCADHFKITAVTPCVHLPTTYTLRIMCTLISMHIRKQRVYLRFYIGKHMLQSESFFIKTKPTTNPFIRRPDTIADLQMYIQQILPYVYTHTIATHVSSRDMAMICPDDVWVKCMGCSQVGKTQLGIDHTVHCPVRQYMDFIQKQTT